MVVKYEKDLQKIVEETNFKDPPFLHRSCAVSYTHLTLPTNREV